MNGDVLEIGDKVVVQVLEENRGWGYNPCPDGTVGIVVGFAELYHRRIPNYGVRPGVYNNTNCPRVLLPNGKTIQIGTFHLESHDKETYDRRLDARKQCYKEDPDDCKAAEDERHFLRELPETPFWEHDVVYCTDKRLENLKIPTWQDQPNTYVVQRIEFDWIHSMGDLVEHKKERTYVISRSPSSGSSAFVPESTLELVQRGNVWRYYHNEPLKFSDIPEEARFFLRLGQIKEIRNPRSGYYTWALDEVLDAIELGTVHGVWGGKSIEVFPAPNNNRGSGYSAVRFLDEDVGNRVAQATIKGCGRAKESK